MAAAWITGFQRPEITKQINPLSPDHEEIRRAAGRLILQALAAAGLSGHYSDIDQDGVPIISANAERDGEVDHFIVREYDESGKSTTIIVCIQGAEVSEWNVWDGTGAGALVYLALPASTTEPIRIADLAPPPVPTQSSSMRALAGFCAVVMGTTADALPPVPVA